MARRVVPPLQYSKTARRKPGAESSILLPLVIGLGMLPWVAIGTYLYFRPRLMTKTFRGVPWVKPGSTPERGPFNSLVRLWVIFTAIGLLGAAVGLFSLLVHR